MRKIVIAYVPVLHEGYRKFFLSHKDAETLYIFGDDVIEKFDHLAKEIRALQPELLKSAIESWRIFKKVEILDFKKIESLKTEDLEIFAPNEDVVQELLDEYFGKSISLWKKSQSKWIKKSP